MIRSGVDAETGRSVEVEFDTRIRSIRSIEHATNYLVPGFIDIQVNGFAGVDYNSPGVPAEEILRSAEAIRWTGVTRFFPTVITGPAGEMFRSLRNLSGVSDPSIEGFHVEGPHLSPEDGPRGAHPLDSIRPPDLDEYRRWQEATEGRVRLVTLSPHWPDSGRYIETLVADGVAVSIGHTHANAEQIASAVSAGATMSTHLGNAAHASIRKQPNYIWDQLADDRLMASFICDGIHLGGAFVKSAIRAKRVERTVLVTDASSPAGAAPGRYQLGQQAVDLTADGRVVLAGTDRLAGSALTMIGAVRNVMRMAGLTSQEALRLATVNPARAVGVAGRQRGLVVGERADLVVLSPLLEVQETIVSS